MMVNGEILEPITIHNQGPPECCHLCGQLDSISEEKKHKQKNCPLRKRAPQHTTTYELAPKGSYKSTYAAIAGRDNTDIVLPQEVDEKMNTQNNLPQRQGATDEKQGVNHNYDLNPQSNLPQPTPK